MVKYTHCPNCGKKGKYQTDTCFLPKKTSKCKYCDMEFELKLNMGKMVNIGDIPVFY